MELFLDTTNKHFLIAIVDNRKVLHFKKIEADRNMVKMANQWMDETLKEWDISYDQITGYRITRGPGSFTGSKVALNIIRSLSLVKKPRRIYSIRTDDLLRKKGKRFVAISHGKNKVFLRDYNKNPFTKKEKFVDNSYLKKIKDKNIIIDYDWITKDHLEERIVQKAFSKHDHIEDIEIFYAAKFVN